MTSMSYKQSQRNHTQCHATKFETKTFGRLKYFLGMEVTNSKKGNFISQQKYVDYFLKGEYCSQQTNASKTCRQSCLLI